jgi:glycosyltransferase involved in cell wall biosynthesis
VGLRKHILFIVENDTVPHDTRVWREALVAKNMGYRISIISPKQKIYSKPYEIIENIEIYRHPIINNVPGGLGYIIEYLNAIFWEFTLCLKIFLRKPFTVIHSANPPDHIFLLALVFRPFRVKFIFDHHDLAPELYLCKFGGKRDIVFRCLNLMERISCKFADAIVTTNNSYKQLVMNKHHIDPEKIFIVRNDPIIEEFSPTSQPGSKGEKIETNLFYLGSINVQDGVDTLVRIVQILVRELHQEQVRCTIVGDGDGLEFAKQISNELGISDYIRFAGYIYDRKIIRDYIEKADICIEPAPDNEANRHSTFIKIMEYMGAQKPLVAFDLEENRATVGDAGVLVKVGDLHEFAKAIERLISDPAEQKRLGKAARDRIVSKLNWPNASEVLIKAYTFLEMRNCQ